MAEGTRREKKEMGRWEFEVEGLGVQRAVEKVRRAGIPVLSAQKTQKNSVRIAVEGKHRKKVFAILRGTCYNVTKVRARGAEKLAAAGKNLIGVALGAALAVSAVFFFESRVLRINVVGSGAYYEEEVRAILSRGGVDILSPAPKSTSHLTAEILALPRVSFCTVKKSGGIVTVSVEVAGEAVPLAEGPLLAPVSGTVEELFAVRGTPCCAVGDKVSAGDVLVADYAMYGEERRNVLVIARAVVVFPVRTEYELGEAGARFQAFLDYGELTEIHTELTEGGCIVSGVARRAVSLNLG